MPSVRQLVTELGLGTAAVQWAYHELQAEGLLVAKPGRGVSVADLAMGTSTRTGEHSDILRALIAPSISHARSLGFGGAELMEAIGKVTEAPQPVTRPPRVVFVGSCLASGDTYRPMLREVLGPLGLAVDGVQFADLERDEHIPDDYEPILMIVAVIGTNPQLREVSERRQTRIYGLVVDLTEETHHAIIHLPQTGDVALIGQRQCLPSAPRCCSSTSSMMTACTQRSRRISRWRAGRYVLLRL